MLHVHHKVLERTVSLSIFECAQCAIVRKLIM